MCSRFAWVSVLARDRAVVRVSSSWPCSALLDVKHKCWRSQSDHGNVFWFVVFVVGIIAK